MTIIIFICLLWWLFTAVWHGGVKNTLLEDPEVDSKKVNRASKFLPAPMIPMVITLLAILAALIS